MTTLYLYPHLDLKTVKDKVDDIDHLGEIEELDLLVSWLIKQE